MEIKTTVKFFQFINLLENTKPDDVLDHAASFQQAFEDKVIDTLNDLKKIDVPKILHCLTLKGKGFDLAEKNQTKCKEIIKNAHNYMSQFSDNKNEEQIEIDVINKYFDILG